MGKLKTRLILAIFSATFLVNGNAAVLTFTDEASFLGALPGVANTLDFEGVAAGTTIADGATVDGITFNYNFDGVQMLVSDVFLTTSGTNFLGTDDADVFQAGDNFSLSFGPVNAIGMFFITADEMFDDDIVLSAGGGSVGLSVADAGADLGDGGIPFFLGIIDTENTFLGASISTLDNCGGCFLFNVDDISTAVVPLPGALWLFISGMLGLFTVRRKTV